MYPLAMTLLCVVAAAIPPLTDEQRTALMTADDGATRDHREAAFWALLENTAQWTGEIGDAPIRLNPDFAALLDDPDAYRGELCRIAGRIEQVEPLQPPYEGVEAWFIRVEDDRPVIAYVDFKDREESRLAFAPGMRIELMARFYKAYERRADGAGRDQQVRVYPAFVGAFPRSASSAEEKGGNFAAVIVPLVIVLGGLFLVVFVLAGRARRKESRHHPRALGDGADVEDALLDLPQEPAEALAVLRDRAQNAD